MRQTNDIAVTILLVDDDDVDVLSMKRALRKARIANPVVVAKDGVDALDCLRGRKRRQKISKPYVIVLDMNMPRMDGVEFLAEIRADPDLRASIVFVLTTSDEDDDRSRAYEHNVAGYVLKSRPGETPVEVVNLLKLYWSIVELPS